MAATDGPQQEPQPQPPATRWALLLLTLAMFCMQSTQSIATQSNAAFATGLYGPENVAAIAAFGGQLVGLGAFVEFIVNVKASTTPPRIPPPLTSRRGRSRRAAGCATGSAGGRACCSARSSRRWAG